MRELMNKTAVFFVAALLLAGVAAVSGQTEKKIEQIRKIYDEVNRKAAECDESGEYSSVYLIELNVNKNDGSYPAVGIYRPVVRFYYTYGDREKNPYPDRLLKAAVGMKRAGRAENYEFYYDDRRNLVFYFEKTEDGEKRIYFDGGRPIRIMENEKVVAPNGKAARAGLTAALGLERRLRDIFSNALDF